MIPNPTGENDAKKPEESDSGGALVSWVVSRVKHAREQRDSKYAKRWEEYTRLWRGFWTDNDKNNSSERSRLIAPALQQAIEANVAEIEEAVFGKEAWFEVDDDNLDQQNEDVVQARDNLLEDFALMGVDDAIAKCFLMGAIYGTGIAKLNVIERVEKVFTQQGPQTSKKKKVTVEAIRPDEFVIDPSATDIESAMFCAHEIVKPRHTILEKQTAGIYRAGFVGTYNGNKTGNPTGTGETSSFQPDDNAVLVTEYYGKVPARFLKGKDDKTEAKGLVEAIVVVANEGTLLRAVKNPFVMGDRPIVAYQHDSVPGEFWGRGISEKGYNPQKALDAELRARIDALALMTAPMMGADITRLPRNPELSVRPGKTVFTRGRPSEVYEPVAFGNPAQLGATFQHTGDLERMVQMGTGAMDSMTPTGISRRNETAGGMSMMLAGALKRTKRTMQNIERQFLNPLIRKATWRYLQFDPQRYGQDYVFTVRSSMGIIAKEVENQQLIQMLGFTPPESPAHLIILKALFENTASSEKKQLKAAIDSLMKPPTPEEQQQQKMMGDLQIKAAVAEMQELIAKAQKTLAEVELTKAKTFKTMIEADLEDDKVEILAANAATGAHKAKVSEAQVHVAREGNQIAREGQALDMQKSREGNESKEKQSKDKKKDSKPKE
jgi:hypothetical protein